MPELTLQRIPFTIEADNQLRMLKARTGITPNILCRIGFCLSLEERGVPASIKGNTKFGREINRYTLLGKHDQVYTAMLVTRLLRDSIPTEEIDTMFLAHINRGIQILSTRIKSIISMSHLANN
ncbi:MAG: DNA sulfur modification protein DndE [Deltaproteobacteria bacterium RIFOXYD12_FULL_53_23]|nr:MAG: DNA sulfur modification protein DndE [Deltaproteobacteria bacterium RIFOXYD12_FULL_53_23]